jgi:hypothetical protein
MVDFMDIVTLDAKFSKSYLYLYASYYHPVHRIYLIVQNVILRNSINSLSLSLSLSLYIYIYI